MKLKNKLLTLLAVFVPLVSSSCQSLNDETRDYDDYVHTSVKDVFSHVEDHYVVYLYRTKCGTCEEIKSSLFDFVDRQKSVAGGWRFYFLEYERKNENPSNDVLVNLTRHDDSLFVDETGDVPTSRYDEFFDDIRSKNVGVKDVREMTYYFTPTMYVVETDKTDGRHVVTDVVVESQNVLEWITNER